MSRRLTQFPLLQLTNGFISFKTYAAAVDLDVFTRLAGGRSVTVEEFAEEFDLQPRPADLLLAALTSLDLLEKTDIGYRNTAIAEEFLVAGKPYYFGGYVKFYNHKLYEGWHHVVDALKSDRPVLWNPDEQETLFTAEDAVVMELFWEAMHALAGFTARSLADVYDFTGHRRLLDVGGGSGGFPIELCSKFPHLTATVYELPHVCPIVTAKVKAAGLDHAIDTAPGNYSKDATLPEGYDVVLLSQIFHNYDEEYNRALLDKVWAALPPGGVVIICEHLLNPDRTGPAEAALMGMNMLVAQSGGKNYSETEYRSWLGDAGFVNSEIVRFEAGGANGAVIARKPQNVR
ncbi:methyltransferase [Lentzea sp. NPDC051213]|uniref:methyltransferase n=1 Tax=Lentzea sp. NPDC051213 TaxID=3364126 RepID=UPI0037A95048